MSHKLLLNLPCFDYFTMTSYEPFFEWLNPITERAEQTKGQQIMQYEGQTWFLTNGHIYVGVGKQKGIRHYMARVTGALAHDEKMIVWEILRETATKLTRVDCQVTVLQPASWSQWDFLTRMQAAGKRPEVRRSSDKIHGELMTIYVGSRESDRFIRLYQKPGAKNALCLRFEVQLQRQQARTFGDMWKANKIHEGQTVRGMVDRTNDPALSSLLMSRLDGYNPLLPAYVRPESKTARWLRTQVLTSFTREINRHDSDGEIASLFLDAIKARHPDLTP